jgi:hypothetical protein
MRFVIDANNFIGIAGLSLGAGLGWAAGSWLAHRILSVIKL